MAAKTWSVRANSGVDELLFQNDTVSLCLLVNRRTRRCGSSTSAPGRRVAKRNFVIAAAKREGVEKVFTLVERDEVSTWTRLGFTREGSIPASTSAATPGSSAPSSRRSARCRAIRAASATTMTTTTTRPRTRAELLAGRRARRAHASPRAQARCSKDGRRRAPRDQDRQRPRRRRQEGRRRGAAERARPHRASRPFGRDVDAHAPTCSPARGGFELYASWETQACFGNSFLELSPAPRTEAERLADHRRACAPSARSSSPRASSAPSPSRPADDVALASVFLANGFRRSAVLAQAHHRRRASARTRSSGRRSSSVAEA